MFDEPSSYLDVKQRLNAAKMIWSLVNKDNYIIVVEHDLAILDYLSDFTCVLYGIPGAYGVVTLPFSVREGINVFLAGFIPTENLWFWPEELNFKVAGDSKKDVEDMNAKSTYGTSIEYPAMSKTLGAFKVEIEDGSFGQSEITVLLGENGTGKSTFIHLLAGLLKPDLNPDGTEIEMPTIGISIKPQKIAPKFEGTVEGILNAKLKGAWQSSVFKTEVFNPLWIEELLDNDVQTLSGGEL